MAKNEKDKQTIVHMTQHRKLKNKQHEPHQKLHMRKEVRLFLTLYQIFETL